MQLLGLTFDKLLLLFLLAAFLLGPKRLPVVASFLGSAVRRLRGWAEQAKQQLGDEADRLGVQEDLRSLREVRREVQGQVVRAVSVLAEQQIAEPVSAQQSHPVAEAAAGWGEHCLRAAAGGSAPYDTEAT